MVFSHTAEFNLPHRYLGCLVNRLLRAPGCHNAHEVRARSCAALYHSSISSSPRGGDPSGVMVRAWSYTPPAAA